MLILCQVGKASRYLLILKYLWHTKTCKEKILTLLWSWVCLFLFHIESKCLAILYQFLYIRKDDHEKYMKKSDYGNRLDPWCIGKQHIWHKLKMLINGGFMISCTTVMCILSKFVYFKKGKCDLIFFCKIFCIS